MNNQFKVKIKSKDETLYYNVYKIERIVKPPMEITTKFLIYDSKNGFHWINSIYCKPV